MAKPPPLQNPDFAPADFDDEELAVPLALRDGMSASRDTAAEDEDERTRIEEVPQSSPEPERPSARAPGPPTPPFGPAPEPVIPRSGLYALLDQAKESGVYYLGAEGAGPTSEASLAPLYVAALQQARSELATLRGVEQVGPAQNDAGDRVLLVTTQPGLSEAALRQIPAQIQGFKTLVVVPYEALPLRRDREDR